MLNAGSCRLPFMSARVPIRSPALTSGFKADVAALMRRWCTDAFTVAGKYCREASPEQHGSCADYHAVRPFLYASGLRTSFDTYAEMFWAPVQQWTTPAREPRVLISGAADFLVPAIVTRALEAIGRDPLVTIIDRCRTPLVMCEDAGQQLSMRWETSQDDIGKHRPSTPHDFIVSDRLLGFVEPTHRSAVIEAWKDQLDDGGRVMTTVSIYPGGRTSITDDDSLLDEIRNRYDADCGSLLPGTSRADLLQMVENYNGQRRSYRICNVDEVLPLFRQCGFEIVSLRKFRRKTDAGLPVDSARHMVQIVAAKPG